MRFNGQETNRNDQKENLLELDMKGQVIRQVAKVDSRREQ